MTGEVAQSNWRPSVAMIPYPGLTLLDLIGTHEILREHTDLHLLGSTTDEFVSDSGAPFRATGSLAEAADYYDVVFVSGGNGWNTTLLHRSTVDHRDR